MTAGDVTFSTGCTIAVLTFAVMQARQDLQARKEQRGNRDPKVCPWTLPACPHDFRCMWSYTNFLLQSPEVWLCLCNGFRCWQHQILGIHQQADLAAALLRFHCHMHAGDVGSPGSPGAAGSKGDIGPSGPAGECLLREIAAAQHPKNHARLKCTS